VLKKFPLKFTVFKNLL